MNRYSFLHMEHKKPRKNILGLLFAHYVGDSVLQTKWISESKTRSWHVMLIHCVIWTSCLCVVLYSFGLFALWKALFLVAGHWISDTLKTLKRRPSSMRKYNIVDQAWHIAQCLIVYLFWICGCLYEYDTAIYAKTNNTARIRQVEALDEE